MAQKMPQKQQCFVWKTFGLCAGQAETGTHRCHHLHDPAVKGVWLEQARAYLPHAYRYGKYRPSFEDLKQAAAQQPSISKSQPNTHVRRLLNEKNQTPAHFLIDILVLQDFYVKREAEDVVNFAIQHRRKLETNNQKRANFYNALRYCTYCSIVHMPYGVLPGIDATIASTVASAAVSRVNSGVAPLPHGAPPLPAEHVQPGGGVAAPDAAWCCIWYVFGACWGARLPEHDDIRCRFEHGDEVYQRSILVAYESDPDVRSDLKRVVRAVPFHRVFAEIMELAQNEQEEVTTTLITVVREAMDMLRNTAAQTMKALDEREAFDEYQALAFRACLDAGFPAIKLKSAPGPHVVVHDDDDDGDGEDDDVDDRGVGHGRGGGRGGGRGNGGRGGCRGNGGRGGGRGGGGHGQRDERPSCPVWQVLRYCPNRSHYHKTPCNFFHPYVNCTKASDHSALLCSFGHKEKNGLSHDQWRRLVQALYGRDATQLHMHHSAVRTAMQQKGRTLSTMLMDIVREADQLRMRYGDNMGLYKQRMTQHYGNRSLTYEDFVNIFAITLNAGNAATVPRFLTRAPQAKKSTYSNHGAADDDDDDDDDDDMATAVHVGGGDEDMHTMVHGGKSTSADSGDSATLVDGRKGSYPYDDDDDDNSDGCGGGVEDEGAAPHMSGLFHGTQLDVCFLLDATGGMEPYFAGVLAAMQRTAQELHATHGAGEDTGAVRFALVAYRDKTHLADDRPEVVHFTPNLDAFLLRLKMVHPQGGADYVEDVRAGLQCVHDRLEFRREATRVVLHIADAPCHGRLFYHDLVDSFPDEDPERVLGLVRWLAKEQIEYVFGGIRDPQERDKHPFSTRKMFDEFDAAYAGASATGRRMTWVDTSEPAALLQVLHQIMASSISTSTKLAEDFDKQLSLGSGPAAHRPRQHQHQPQRQRRVDMQPGAIMWGTVPAMSECTTTSLKLQCDFANMPNLKADMFAEETRAKRRMQLYPLAFNKGTFRVVHRARALFASGSTKLVVVKRPIFIVPAQRERELCLGEMREQTVAQKLALEFMKELKRAGIATGMQRLKLVFAKPNLVEVKGAHRYHEALRALAPHMEVGDLNGCWVMEKQMINGNYTKYSNNAGKVNHADTPEGMVVHAFSHWTHARTRGRFMVVDLQGTCTEMGIFLTDPVVHDSRNKEFGRLFSAGDRGARGIRDFFRTHKCNHICRGLQLRKPAL